MDNFSLFCIGILLGFVIISLFGGLGTKLYISNNYQYIFQYCNADMNLDICVETIKYNKNIEKIKTTKVSIND